ncbi:MAG: hypothetical protein M3083_07470 [Actinomycetota bacterium]|nr:hypothetical protein [Actinomycetota bacterium]
MAACVVEEDLQVDEQPGARGGRQAGLGQAQQVVLDEVAVEVGFAAQRRRPGGEELREAAHGGHVAGQGGELGARGQTEPGPAFGGVGQPNGVDGGEADPVRPAVGLDPQPAGVPGVAGVDDVRVAAGGQVLEAGVGVTQQRPLVERPVAHMGGQVGQPCLEWAVQQRRGGRAPQQLDERGHDARCERSGPLVVTALQDIGHLPAGHRSQPEQVEAVAAGSRLATNG